MINVELRDGNQIVTLTVDDKKPLLTRASGFMYYNPMELLCISVASCVGVNIQRECRYGGVNVQLFESIQVGMENFKVKIFIQHPEDMDEEFLKLIRRRLESCEVVGLLKEKPTVTFLHNKQPTMELIKEKPKGCCGG